MPIDIVQEFPDARASGQVVNDNTDGRGDATEAVVVASARHAERVERETAPLRRASDEERAARELVQTTLWRQFGIEEPASLAVRGAKERFLVLRDVAMVDRESVSSIVTRPPEPAIDMGVWWWGLSDWVTPPDKVGLFGYFDQAAGGSRLVGQLEWDDGDLWKGSARAWSIFGIGSDRLPPGGRYLSTPPTDLFGEVLGFTGVSGPFSFGDMWCKCWLHTTQTVRDNSGAVVALGHAASTLIFQENDGESNLAPLPGSLIFPTVSFDVQPGVPLTTTVEVKFDFQFEGEGTLRFGNYAGVAPSLFRTPQWTLVKA